jgi:hypothetical protein
MKPKREKDFSAPAILETISIDSFQAAHPILNLVRMCFFIWSYLCDFVRHGRMWDSHWSTFVTQLLFFSTRAKSWFVRHGDGMMFSSYIPRF